MQHMFKFLVKDIFFPEILIYPPKTNLLDKTAHLDRVNFNRLKQSFTLRVCILAVGL